MSDDASTSASKAAPEEPHWSDKLPMWGPAVLLVVLAIVLKFSGDPAQAVAKPAPAAPVAAAATAEPDAEAVDAALLDAATHATHEDGEPVAAGAEVAAISAPPPPAYPPAPRMPAPAQAYASPWAVQGQQQAFQQYAVQPQNQPKGHHQPPAMPAQAAAPAGNNPYVPCAAPYYWCVPALPGQ